MYALRLPSPARPVAAIRGVASDAAWGCFVVGVSLAFFWRYLGWFGAEGSFGSADTTNIFWPLHKFNVTEWQAGRVPLWNNAFSAGLPQVGNTEAGAFYPLGLIELMVAGRGGPMTGFYTRMWLDSCIAALGMYFLVRRLTANRTAAALSAVTFSCSGLLLGYAVAQISHIEALAWIPWILFFLHRSLHTPSPSPVSEATLQRGVGQSPTCVSLAPAALCTAGALLGGYPQMWLIMGLAGLTMVAALGLTDGAVAWRRAALHATVICGFGVGLAALQLVPAVELFLSSDRSVHGGVGQGYAWSQLLGLVVPGEDGDLGLYTGILAVLLAPAALLGQGRRRLAACWGAAALIGLLVSLGDTTPLYRAVFSHLGFGLFRNQAWNVALVVIALSVLSGLGLDALRRRVSAPLAAGFVALPLLAAMNLLLASWGNNFPSAERFIPWPERFPRILNTLIADQRREPMRFIVDGRVDVFSPQGVGDYGLESVSSELNYRLQRTFQLTETDAFWRQWQLFNVRFVVSSRELRTEGLTEVVEARDGSLRLFRMDYALPRAYVVWRARQVDGAEQALRAILNAGFDPGSEVVLEGPPVQVSAPPSQPSQKIDYRRVHPGEVALATEVSAPGLLVLSEPHYPGWKVAIDGQPAPLLRANYAFSAVLLPAGAHQVRFFYEPDSFRLGLAISVLTLILGCALVARDLARRPGLPASAVRPD